MDQLAITTHDREFTIHSEPNLPGFVMRIRSAKKNVGMVFDAPDEERLWEWLDRRREARRGDRA